VGRQAPVNRTRETDFTDNHQEKESVDAEKLAGLCGRRCPGCPRASRGSVQQRRLDIVER
jgi:hypothetical protein